MRGLVGYLCVAWWGARGESGLRNCERPPLAEGNFEMVPLRVFVKEEP